MPSNAFPLVPYSAPSNTLLNQILYALSTSGQAGMVPGHFPDNTLLRGILWSLQNGAFSGGSGLPTTLNGLVYANGTGAPTALGIGSGLSIVGGNLTATGGGASGVSSFNTRTGAVTFQTSDLPASVATSTNNLSFFAPTTSAQLLATLTDGTGTGSNVFANSPEFTGTPTLSGNALTALGNTVNTVGYLQPYLPPAGSNVIILGDSVMNGSGGAFPGQILSTLPGWTTIPVYSFAVTGSTAGPVGTSSPATGQYILANGSQPYKRWLNGAQTTGNAAVSSLTPTGSGINYYFVEYGINDSGGGFSTTGSANFSTYLQSITTTCHGYNGGVNTKVVGVTFAVPASAAAGKTNGGIWNNIIRQLSATAQNTTSAGLFDYICDWGAAFGSQTCGTYTGDVMSLDGIHPTVNATNAYARKMADTIQRNIQEAQTYNDNAGMFIQGGFEYNAQGIAVGSILMASSTTNPSGSINTSAGTTGSGGPINTSGNGSHAGGGINTSASATAAGAGISMQATGSGTGTPGTIFTISQGNFSGGGLITSAGTAASGGALHLDGGNSTGGTGGSVTLSGVAAIPGGTLVGSNSVNTYTTSESTPHTLTIPSGYTGTFAVFASTGTATLVGGTATVTYAGLTSTSKIRLSSAGAIGGTTGAPFVSARTNGTGFTISSTNALDTSVIGYEITPS